MFIGSSSQFSHESCILKNYKCTNQSKHLDVKNRTKSQKIFLSSHVVKQDYWSLQLSKKISRPLYFTPHTYHGFRCRSFSMKSAVDVFPILKSTTLALHRSYDVFRGFPVLLQVVQAVGFIAFSVWALEPLSRCARILFLQKDTNWKKSRTHYICTSYLRPLFLWAGIVFVCRALDPVVLTSQASQAIKQRLLNFIKSLSTILAFAYCLSSLIPQVQKLILTNESNGAQKMGADFASKTVYTAIWVAGISLFMELLGFSTQKWLTAGGLGTVLLTLAGREIFTNFLSSLMIHATRPFVLNEWIQTRIDGYEVSGTVEHVGWWSPTVIRGDDREAVHIPNHKFTVNIVRNLSQKTHWRVKTHFAISHFDANKISNIVADMRKVLAKNPLVEQQRLHRRVFFDYIEPENQAFMILVSCFVKTSRFEEYLCVKEGILLDLLRVISHHKARLATPIRTVQKLYNDEVMEDTPFGDSIITGTGAHVSRPLYFIETTSRMNEDKTRSRSEQYVHEDQTLPNSVNLDEKSTDRVSKESYQHDREREKSANPIDSSSQCDNSLVEGEPDDDKQQIASSPHTSTSLPISRPEDFELVERHSKSKDTTVSRSPAEEIPASTEESVGERSEGSRTATVLAKHEKEKMIAKQSLNRSSLEDNIVLGVALDGAKRTLPIEEEMDPSSAELKMEK